MSLFLLITTIQDMNSSHTHYGIFFAIPSLLLLSGCGDIQIPESIPTPLPIATTPPVEENTATPTPLAKTNSCTVIEQEKKELAEAITISQTELATCKTEKQQLLSLSANAQTSENQITQISPLLKKYITEIKQEEYKFDSCGNLTLAKNTDWFKDFTASLENSTLFFSEANRQLQPTDFYSACISNEGKTALFLGASADGKKEFHMIKYNFEKKQLSEAILLGGTCDLCPNKFGKRFGPFITLNASYGSTNTVFNYYYDSNLIEKK